MSALKIFLLSPFILGSILAQIGEKAEVTILPLTLPFPMTYTTAVYDNDDTIYIIGGSISDSLKSDVIYRFSLRNESLTIAGQMPFDVYTGHGFWDPISRTIFYFYGSYAYIFKIRIGEDGNVAEVDLQGGESPLMFATSAWDPVERKVWILGHPLFGGPYNFYEYNLNSEVLTWLNGSFPGEISDTTMYYDEQDKLVYILGGYDWNEPSDRASDRIFSFDPTTRVTTLLETRLTYRSDVIKGVAGNGGVYVFDTGYIDHKGIMKFNPRANSSVHYMEVPHFLEYTIIRCGAAFVPKLNRIYMFGGNDESWWNHATDRIQFAQIYSPIT